MRHSENYSDLSRANCSCALIICFWDANFQFGEVLRKPGRWGCAEKAILALKANITLYSNEKLKVDNISNVQRLCAF